MSTVEIGVPQCAQVDARARSIGAPQFEQLIV